MRIRQWWEQVQGNLFYVPLSFTVGAVILAEPLLLVDAGVDGLPDGLAATVDSARSILSVIASATLTFAGIAFSVSLLLIASSSSQYGPPGARLGRAAGSRRPVAAVRPRSCHARPQFSPRHLLTGGQGRERR